MRVSYVDDREFADSDLTLAGWAKKLTGRYSMTVGAVGLSTGLFAEDGGETKPVAIDNLDAIARRFERGEFDLVAIGRALLSDPAWVRKARLGEPFDAYDGASMRALN